MLSSKALGGSSHTNCLAGKISTLTVSHTLSLLWWELISCTVYKGGKAIPALGSTHGLDIDIMDDYVIHFAATLDPSIGDGIVWPKWTSDTPDMLVIGADGLSIAPYTYRE